MDPDIRELGASSYLDPKTAPLLQLLRNTKPNGKTSDGYHTFGELYDHRIGLWIMLCKYVKEVYDLGNPSEEKQSRGPVWRSKCHSDGTALNGWFLLGINETPGKQMTYHLPLTREMWKRTEFARTLELAPEFDGHTSADVLDRISKL